MTLALLRKKAIDQAWYELGRAKLAGDAELTHSLAGRLYLSASGWLMLSVPNALARGALAALDEAGAELPLHSDGTFNAHISVMRPEEIEQIGGPDKISERGKAFHYTLGPVKTVVPKTWDGVSRVWYITVYSPELRELRRSYGLSAQPNSDWDFHVTIGRRRTGVLHENSVSKVADAVPGGLADEVPRSEFDPKSLEAGKKVEMEHTDDPEIAKEIATDHLHEFPRYYSALSEMEKNLETKKEKKAFDESYLAKQEARRDPVPDEIRKLQLSGKLTPLGSGYGECYWDPDSKRVHLVSWDGDESEDVVAWKKALENIEGVEEVTCDAEYCPPQMRDKQRIPEPGRGVYSDVDLTKEAENLLITLRRIKEFSDQKKYKAKERMLRRLMLANPQDWLVDQPAPYHPGVTHVPSGFRYHTTRRGIPPEVPVKKGQSPLQSLPQAAATPLSRGPATDVSGKPLPAWQQALVMPARLGMQAVSWLRPKPPAVQPQTSQKPQPALKRADHAPSSMAETSLWTTPIQIDPAQGVLGNVRSHLERLRDNFRSQIANRHYQSNLQTAVDPSYGWRRAHQIAQGIDPFVDNPLDRALSQLV